MTANNQLCAKDWLDQGLRTLAKSGFTALKAEPLAKAMGVSRGSFYWHFADVEAYHSALLGYWRDIAAEQIIADIGTSSDDGEPIDRLLRRVFAANPSIEMAIRTWATVDPVARRAVAAIDQRRLRYVAKLLRTSGLAPGVANTRAQILYWAFFGFAALGKPLSRSEFAAVTAQLISFARAKSERPPRAADVPLPAKRARS